MAIDPKKRIAIREEIRKKIREGLKSSAICEMGYDSEIVLEVKAEENNIRDKQQRQEEKDFQKRQQEAKRERQYRQTMIDLGQDPDKVTENAKEDLPVETVADAPAAPVVEPAQEQTTVGAPAAEVETASQGTSDQSNAGSAQ